MASDDFEKNYMKLDLEARSNITHRNIPFKNSLILGEELATNRKHANNIDTGFSNTCFPLKNKRLLVVI